MTVGRSARSTDVAQTQHCRAVGHDCDGVRQIGVEVRVCRVVADREAYARDTGRVNVAQDLGGRDRQRGLHADLATAVTVQDAVRLADEPRIGQRIDRRIELRICGLVDLDSDLPERPSLAAAQRLQMLDDQLLVGDDGEHACERSRPLHRFDEKDLGDFHVSGTTTARG
jgi:hypothetical protein